MKKILVTLLMLVIVSFVAKTVGNSAGLTTAKYSVEQEAIQQGIPTGFFGVKWLATSDEVRSIRPNVFSDSNGNLKESNDFLGRKAFVTYHSTSTGVMLFTFTFTDDFTTGNFDKTQTLLATQVGQLGKVTQLPGLDRVCSSRVMQRFRVDHCQPSDLASIPEQILIYRTK